MLKAAHFSVGTLPCSLAMSGISTAAGPLPALTRSDASLRMLSTRAGTLPASQIARHIMSTEACLQPDSQAVHTAVPPASSCLWQQFLGQWAGWHKESVRA